MNSPTWQKSAAACRRRSGEPGSSSERHVHCMFAFLEFHGAGPANNASGRALRYVVVLCKITGQTKGGAGAMKRLADFVTCVLTWRANGSSAAEEVGRLI